ncbi:MAG: dihydroorotate dehydrogenase [Firmicutes bacterium]|nr:dihydroorotate dehydrogenase [Bacillota bacterium]
MHDSSLEMTLSGIRLNNPILSASGPFGYGLEYLPLMNKGDLGALVVTGTTFEPRPGNPPPRIHETPAGMLNAVGLENCGVEQFAKEILPKLAEYNLPIIVNIAGKTIDEYIKIVEYLEKVPNIAGYELNISCPNVEQGGMAFGTDPDIAYTLTERVKQISTKPVIVKLSPNVTDITVIAQAAEAAGADCISLVNTFLAMAIDIEKQRPVLGNVVGGLSGPAIRPIALRMVWQAASAVDIPIIGMGGIDSWESALEFILAGATAVAVGTAFFTNPGIAQEIKQGLQAYMEKNMIDSLEKLVGAALPQKTVGGCIGTDD